jgi:hypothetical protein
VGRTRRGSTAARFRYSRSRWERYFNRQEPRIRSRRRDWDPGASPASAQPPGTRRTKRNRPHVDRDRTRADRHPTSARTTPWNAEKRLNSFAHLRLTISGTEGLDKRERYYCSYIEHMGRSRVDLTKLAGTCAPFPMRQDENPLTHPMSTNSVAISSLSVEKPTRHTS